MRRWTVIEEELLKRKYLTHSARELVMALASIGFVRTRSAVYRKLNALGLCRSEDMMPFSYQVTDFCDTGDEFLAKVESDFRHYHSPYIVARNEKGQQAIFAQPFECKGNVEPAEERWVRWYLHPAKETWPY